MIPRDVMSEVWVRMVPQDQRCAFNSEEIKTSATWQPASSVTILTLLER